MTWLILLPAALLTSIISGFVGMAGGITLLAVLTFIYPIHVLLPLHGTVQFFSNISRTFMLRHEVRRPVLIAFLPGVIPGALAAWTLLLHLPHTEWILILIIVLLFYTALRPQNLPELRIGRPGFFVLGMVTGFLGPLMGATGPLLAPFFLRSDYRKEEIVATKAACQMITHVVKFPVFFSLGFRYGDYAAELLVMVAGVVVGTRIGITVLRRASPGRFLFFLKLAMVLTGVRLILKLAGII